MSGTGRLRLIAGYRSISADLTLAAAFSDYPAYAAATPRFVPRVGEIPPSPQRESAHDAATSAR